MTKVEAVKVLTSRNTVADQFMLAAMRQKQARGGRPKAEIVNGQIVFTYPDGTKTCGGARIN